MKRIPLNIDALRDAINYNPDTGELTWKVRDRKYFLRDSDWTKAKNKAGTKVNLRNHHNGSGKSYLIFSIAINGKSLDLLAHRVCYAIHHGVDPEYIDHINGDGCDNRISNLRSVSLSENNKNVRMHKTNTSGVCGVYYIKKYDLWDAMIWVNNKQVNLGRYDTKQEAIAARKAAEKVLGYHENHGKEK